MRRAPFVWEIQVRREVLQDEIERLRDLPYSLWREVIASPLTRTATGRDGKSYRVRVRADWAAPGSENIRVSVGLRSSRLRRSVLTESFVISPDNRFVE